MIIGINGYLNSGKDTVGLMIQYHEALKNIKSAAIKDSVIKQGYNSEYDYTAPSGWHIKKFADKLKQIASMLTGIPREKFEDRAFKDSIMSPEWNTWSVVFDADGSRYGYLASKEEALKFEQNERLALAWPDSFKTRVEEFPTTVREFLQRLGTDAIRDNVHQNAWVNSLFIDYTKNTGFKQWGETLIEERYPNWIITDTRFPNEAKIIKDKGGLVIRINRPSLTQDSVERKHPSETSLDDWDFDYVIDNDGTLDELYEKVKRFMETLTLGINHDKNYVS